MRSKFQTANKIIIHIILFLIFPKSECHWLSGLQYGEKGTCIDDLDVDLPTSQAKSFSQARGMSRRFLSVFGRESEQESVLGTTTRTGNEKRRTLRESNDHAKSTAVWFSIGETTSKQKMHNCLH